MLLSFMMDKASFSKLQLFLLGPPQIKLNGLFVNIEERKAIALLAYLAVSGARHSRDALSTMLWPEQSQGNARASLRHALWSLKAVGLDSSIDKRPGEISLHPQYWLDLDEFNKLIAEHRQHGHAPGEGCSICLASLAEAITLYKDDFLAGFTLRDSPEFDEWQYFQREHWKQLLAYALECMARWHMNMGEWAQATEYARRWVSLDPLQEPAQRWLMRIYTGSGKRSLALRQYETLKKLLSEELGTAAEIETSGLADVIRSGMPVVQGWEPSVGEVVSQTPASPHIHSQLRDRLGESVVTFKQLGPRGAMNDSPFIGSVSQARSAPFLERESFIERLTILLSSVRVEGGRMVFLGAEAGGGKTMLIRRFCVEMQKKARIFIGICDPLSTPRPLGPLWDIADEVDIELSRMIRDGEKPERIFHAFLETLRRAETPYLVVIEDVHWSNEATLDLLRLIGRRIESTHALVIASFRDDEVEGRHPVRILLGDLATSSGIERFHLPPLSKQAVGTLVASSRLDLDEVYRRTGGNPFYITEMLASGLNRLPDTVRDAVLVRAARLSSSARSVLDFAAVVGPSAEVWLLMGMSNQEANAVEECLAAGMLLAREDGMEFRHALAQQAILEAISPPRLQVLHSRALEGLRGVKMNPGGLARLAHHAEGARDHQAVLEYAPAAARQASEAGAHRQAAAQYERVLRFANRQPAQERAQLWQAYARECFLCDRHGPALHALEEAEQLWREIGDRLEEGDNLDQQSSCLYNLGRFGQAEQANRKAIEILSAFPGSPQLAHAYCRQSSFLAFASDYEAAVTVGKKAIELGERIGDVQTLIRAHNLIGVSLIYCGEPIGQAHVEHSIALAREVNDHIGVAMGYSNLGRWVGLMIGWDAGNSFITEGLEHCAEFEMDYYKFNLLATQADAQLYQGHWSSIKETLQFILSQQNVAADTRFWALVELGRLHARRGDPGVSAILNPALELAEQFGVLQFLAPARAARAEASWLAGEPDRVLEEVRAVYDLAVQKRHIWYSGELAYWLWRAGEVFDPPDWAMPVFVKQIRGDWASAAAEWQHRGCPYERAWALADGDEEARLTALEIFDQLGAAPAATMLRRQLQAQGAQRLPRGRRQATLQNLQIKN